MNIVRSSVSKMKASRPSPGLGQDAY